MITDRALDGMVYRPRNYAWQIYRPRQAVARQTASTGGQRNEAGKSRTRLSAGRQNQMTGHRAGRWQKNEGGHRASEE
jgi:hypothetical protein